MKTHEIEIPADRLSNMAWCRLHELVGNELGGRAPELDAVAEAETVLQFKKALALKADFLVIRIRYPEASLTTSESREP